MEHVGHKVERASDSLRRRATSFPRFRLLHSNLVTGQDGFSLVLVFHAGLRDHRVLE